MFLVLDKNQVKVSSVFHMGEGNPARTVTWVPKRVRRWRVPF